MLREALGSLGQNDQGLLSNPAGSRKTLPSELPLGDWVMIHASTKAIRIGSWHGVEEPASSRLGTTTMEIDLLDSKTRLCSLGTEVSESRGPIQPVGSPGQERLVY